MNNSQVNAYNSRKLAEEMKWWAEHSQREKYYDISRKLWDAYEALLNLAKQEDIKTNATY